MRRSYLMGGTFSVIGTDRKKNRMHYVRGGRYASHFKRDSQNPLGFGIGIELV